ncbi:MAG: HEAT repeat domain-containing protein [Candidatus Omnitrophica bacterium]|nr:HEAT repeat domain-containing protein [Candidatus Omnitrophota bacterium]
MRRIITGMVVYIICGILLLLKAEAGEVDATQVNDKYAKILVTSKVVEALGRIGNPEASDFLVQALGSKEFFIRANAAQALGRIGNKEPIPLLKKLVNDKNYLVRILSVGALVNLGQKDMEDSLFTFLKNDDQQIRTAAVEEMGRLSQEMSGMGEGAEKLGMIFLSALNEMLSIEKDGIVRAKIIETLGGNRYAPASDNINQALSDPNIDVRRAACYAVGEIGDKKHPPLLLEKLGDEDVIVRSIAKEALSKMGETSAIKFFWDDIEDENPFLKTSSYVALAYLKDLDILPILLREIVKPENPTIIKKQAAAALVLLKSYVSDLANQAWVDSNLKYNLLLSENLQVRYKVNGKDLTLIFVEAMEDDKDPLYQDAPLILKELGDRLALPALRESLLQDDPDLVAASAYALGEMQDNDAVGYLLKVFKKYGI